MWGRSSVTEIQTRIRLRPFLHTVLSHCWVKYGWFQARYIFSQDYYTRGNVGLCGRLYRVTLPHLGGYQPIPDHGDPPARLVRTSAHVGGCVPKASQWCLKGPLIQPLESLRRCRRCRVHNGAPPHTRLDPSPKRDPNCYCHRNTVRNSRSHGVKTCKP
jgi:hypothetical protein